MARTLALAEEMRLNPAPPRLRPQMAAPPPPPPRVFGPPVPGDAARLIAVWLRWRQVDQQERPVRDRGLVHGAQISAQARCGEISEAERRIAVDTLNASLIASDARVRAARERFEKVRGEVFDGRLVRGAHPDAERVWRTVFPDEARPVPWGYRPAVGERLKPVAVPTPPPAPSFAEMVVERILGRPVPNREEAK